MAGLFDSLEQQYSLPNGLLDAVWKTESGRGQNMLSPAGAQGHFQFMPATARQYGLDDPNNLVESATAAARMYSDLLRQTGGSLPDALAAYNWGIGNLQRKGMDRAPAETRNYIQKVTANMDPSTLAPGMANLQNKAKEDDPFAAIAASAFGKPQQGAAGPAAAPTGPAQAAPEDDPFAAIARNAGLPVGAKDETQAAKRREVAAAKKAADDKEYQTKRLWQLAYNTSPVGALMGATNTDPRDVLAGIPAGMADIGNTLINGASWVANKVLPADRVKDWNAYNADRQAGLKSFDDEHKDSLAYQASKIGTQIAATYPVGGALATPFKALGKSEALMNLAPKAAEWLTRFGTAAETAGGTTGVAADVLKAAPTLAKAGDVATRAAGGAVTGAAQAGLINPDDAGQGAAFGAALPVAFAGISKLGVPAVNKVVQMWREYGTPADQLKMQTIMKATGLKSADEVEAALKAYNAKFGDAATNGAKPSVATVMGDNSGLSQLERSLYEKGNTAVINSQKEFREGGRSALGQLGAIDVSPATSGEAFGHAAGAEIRAGNEAARAQVKKLAEPLNDPMNLHLPRVTLPLMEMEGALGRTIGPGTFGQGDTARLALKRAEAIGTEDNPAYAAWVARGREAAKPKALEWPTLEGQGTDLFTPPPKVTGAAPMTLEQAVRKAGGIRHGGDYAGELKILGQDIGGIINKNGKSADEMAALMKEAGYLDDESGATLLNALRDKEGRKVVAAEGAQSSAERRMAEHQRREYEDWLDANGGKPPELPAAPATPKPAPAPQAPLGPEPPQTRDRAVAFTDVKQYRDSLSSAIRGADPGSPEQAALIGMKKELDKHLDSLAAGKLGPRDYYPPEMADQWRLMRQEHAARKNLFSNRDTAPIASVATRNPGQDATLGNRFFRPGAQGGATIDELNRLPISGDTRQLLKDMAIGQMGSLNRGKPTGSSLLDYMNKRDPAMKGLFSQDEQDTISKIAGALKRQEDALDLGKAKGSPTYQLFKNDIENDAALSAGWLDALAGHVPTKIGRSATGAVLGGLRQGAKARNAEMLGKLTTDPEYFITVMRKLQERNINSPLMEIGSPTALGSAIRRTTPVLLAQ